jgi:hypothetical protein
MYYNNNKGCNVKENDMSCYNWEEGTLILPVRAFKPVFDSIRQKQNALMDEAYNCLVAAYETIMAENKAKVKPAEPELHGRICDAAEKHRQKIRSRFSGDDLFGAIENAVIAMSKGRKVPIKPQKQYLAKATTSTLRFRQYEAYLTFDRKRHSLTWVVEENNHAVESAHESWLGRALSASLKDVQWTRSTGGLFVGNDEYNEDSQENGGGANYVTARFGPLGGS